MSAEKFIIIYDTYCGWCYGAHPSLQALAKSGAEVETLHRHLFSGANAHKMADGFGEQAIRIDAHIGKVSGQEFSQTYIDNILKSKTEILDSSLTAQAAALIHDQGAAAELSLAARLQKARYVQGISALDRESIIAALVEEGIAPNEASQIGSAELQAKAKTTSERAQKLLQQIGANGVPTVLKITNGHIEIVDISKLAA